MSAAPAPIRSLTRWRASRIAILAGALESLACFAGQTAAAEKTHAGQPSSPQPAPRFLARLEFPTSRGALAKPSGLLAGDLDGDGRDELIAATRSPGGIEVWRELSPVLGPAPEPRVFAIGDYPVGPVWFGPLLPARESEHALAAVASRETLELSVLDLRAALRSKNAAEAPVAWRARLPARPRALASGDLHRDGAPDLAVITVEDELLLYSGPGEPRRVPLAAEHATCALITSDGARIAIGYQGSRKVALLAADGTVEKTAELPGLPRDLSEADLDGDGDTELLVAAGEESLLVFGLSRPGGSAAWLDAKPVEVHVGTIPIDLEHGKFDGDGREEVLVLDLHSQDYQILGWPLAPAGGPPAPRARGYAGQRPFDCVVGDFDGDGALDLAIASPDARRVSLLFGARGRSERKTALFESDTRVPCDRSPHSIAAGDFDGDKLPEVLALAGAEGTLSVFRNEHGVLAAGMRVLATGDADAIACADLDGDGRLDAAWLQRTAKDRVLAMAFGDGACGLSPRPDRPPIPVGRGACDLLLADLDRDGFADAVVVDAESDLVLLLRDFAKPGSPAVAMSSTRIASGPCALAILERPGAAPEIAVALGGSGSNRDVVLFGVKTEPTGEWTLEQHTVLSTPFQPRALAAADLDGDGREDLAVLATAAAGDSQGYVIPMLRREDGSWRTLTPMKTGMRPYRIAAGDLGGDGRAEILVTAQNNHHVEAWLARAGDPVSFDRAPDLGAGTGPLDLALIDLDGDGRPEIVVANAFSDDLSVIRVK